MRIGRGAWSLLLCLATGGCDLLFQVNRIPERDDATALNDTLGTDRPDDAMPDSGSPDAATACANPTFYEPFTGPTACAHFNDTPYMTDATVVQANGVLNITPNPAFTTETVGGCQSANSYPFGSGLVAIVNDALAGGGAYTVLYARAANAQIKVGGDSMLHFQTAQSVDIGPPIAYSPSMRWWRIKPVGGSQIIAEYSTNGMNWFQLGAGYNVNPPATIVPEITGGSTTGGNVGTATFDEVMICP